MEFTGSIKASHLSTNLSRVTCLNQPRHPRTSCEQRRRVVESPLSSEMYKTRCPRSMSAGGGCGKRASGGIEQATKTRMRAEQYTDHRRVPRTASGLCHLGSGDMSILTTVGIKDELVVLSPPLSKRCCCCCCHCRRRFQGAAVAVVLLMQQVSGEGDGCGDGEDGPLPSQMQLLLLLPLLERERGGSVQ